MTIDIESIRRGHKIELTNEDDERDIEIVTRVEERHVRTGEGTPAAPSYSEEPRTLVELSGAQDNFVSEGWLNNRDAGIVGHIEDDTGDAEDLSEYEKQAQKNSDRSM